MARGGRRSGLAPDSFVEARTATHLMWRLGARVHAVLSTRGAASTPGWRALAVASAGADLAGVALLGRDRRFHLLPRLAVDAGDLVLWCMAAGDDPDTTSDSVIPGVALAAEAGARMGPAGLVVPAVNAAVLALVRRHRGHELRLWQAGWQVMGVLGGWGLSVSAARRRQTVEVQRSRNLEARLHAAELAGYHSLVSDADPVADRLQRATALLDLGGARRAAANPVGAWKAALAELTRQRATFLADALFLWQADHNLHPDLASATRFDLEPGAGTVLLTLDQADELRSALDGLDLRGAVDVRLAEPAEARRPDGRRDLVVAGRDLPLTRPAGARPSHYDAVPTAFCMSALWLLPPMSDTREGVPFRSTAGPLALNAGAAAWAGYRADRDGLAPRSAATLVSGLSTAAYTLASARSARTPHSPDGASWYPWMLALQGFELVTEHCGPELPPRRLLLARAAAAALVGMGWACSPRPRSTRALLSEVVWPVGIGFWARATARASEQHATRSDHRIEAEEAAAVVGAAERGRERVLAYLSAELARAERDLDDHGEGLDGPVRDEARRRLAVVADELGRLTAPPAVAVS